MFQMKWGQSHTLLVSNIYTNIREKDETGRRDLKRNHEMKFN